VTSGRNALLPAIGANPANGRIAIAYYAVRRAGIDLELVESTPTRSGWTKPHTPKQQIQQRHDQEQPPLRSTPEKADSTTATQPRALSNHR
jgi:hypothetical protein